MEEGTTLTGPPAGTDGPNGHSDQKDTMEDYLDGADDEDEMEESLESFNWDDLQEGPMLLTPEKLFHT